jgi:high-affinity Fe2+/Pb2+ permease
MDWWMFFTSGLWTVGGVVAFGASIALYRWLSKNYNDEMETIAGALIVLLVVLLLTGLVYVSRKAYMDAHPFPAEAVEQK